jgi:hypothetical protein
MGCVIAYRGYDGMAMAACVLIMCRAMRSRRPAADIRQLLLLCGTPATVWNSCYCVEQTHEVRWTNLFR